MYFKVENFSRLRKLKIILVIVLLLLPQIIISKAIFANDIRFKSEYPCFDEAKICVDSGSKIIDGSEVHRNCWEWVYTKTCNYPSKNDCAQYAKCYSLGQRNCLLHDSLGNCVNLQKEFSCKRWVPIVIESESVKYGIKDKAGAEGLVCDGLLPCIDGNCIDKSYTMDADMVSSISQLGALAQGKSDGVNFKIFEGLSKKCSKKPIGYHNCCQVHPKGWGQDLLGAQCSSDEKILAEKRASNLCVYVGKKNKRLAGVIIDTRHYYCCFGNMLEKIVQVQGRKQLGFDFGSGSDTNCRGLTLDELARIDFSKIDFSEVAAEMQKKIVMPRAGDIKARIKNSFDNSIRFDPNQANHPKNKAVGFNPKLKEK